MRDSCELCEFRAAMRGVDENAVIDTRVSSFDVRLRATVGGFRRRRFTNAVRAAAVQHNVVLTEIREEDAGLLKSIVVIAVRSSCARSVSAFVRHVGKLAGKV